MTTNKRIDINQLQNDSSSFLSLRPEDPVLQKLETYRLYKNGVTVKVIADAFNFSRPYLHQMWRDFEQEGVIAMVNKNWGAEPRRITKEVEAKIIRAKAIKPQRSDADLSREFGLSRTSVYRLLKEHGIQDLHKFIEQHSSRQKRVGAR